MIDADKRAFTAQQQVRTRNTTLFVFPFDVSECDYVSTCVMIPGAVDGGEAQSSRWSVWRLRGASVSAVPGAAGVSAGEGGCNRTAGAAAGGAGKKKHTHKEFQQMRCQWSNS